ncbi:uncharacterized protein N7498_007993 [Penicillium cinerascens]|uniref:Uncharacterized protein n=1 Tax=Penicillium cinerascens TaxID=70096 RepID=A0A9W9JCU5_9EURO|nr:uncharacterized protein N7498_007993 [Penicillium cinerascens]KAJ5194555.1 hypothetical protein N7498_007993 [Penicillium cinerascens]
MASDSHPSPTSGPELLDETSIAQPPTSAPSVHQGVHFDLYQPNLQKPNKTMALPLLLFPDGDTLVYIDPAPEHGAQSLPRPTAIHRVHSDKLLVTGSTYFQRRLGLRQQNRVRKQRGFPYKLPDGIKYVLDLTPPMLEEDAILSMTEVSCPMGIRTWASSRSIWDLPIQCVGGNDENETVEEVVVPAGWDNLPTEEDHGFQDEQESENENEEEEVVEEKEERELPHTRQRAGLPVEYSANRHRDGIEQILHVLEGLNVTLDTPCKLWTFFAVAKLFDVATVPAVGDLISSWFYMANNTRFIEIHPEIAYRVACGIRSHTLCRNAFVGLVGDEALLYLIRSGRLRPLRAWEKHFARSRVSDRLDDTEVQRIEYASKSFAEDVIGHFLHLAGVEMTWLADIVEFRKLTQHIRHNSTDKNMVLQLIVTLRDYIRHKIYRALDSVKDPWRPSDAVPKGGPDPYFIAFRNRDLLHRIIGRKFWMELLALNFASSEPYSTNDHASIAEVGSGLLAFRGQESARLRCISHTWLGQRVDDFNRIVSSRAKAAVAAQLANQRNRWSSSLNRPWPLPFADASTSLPFRPTPGSNALTDIDVNTSLPFRPAPSRKNPTTSLSDEIDDKFDSIIEEMRLEMLSTSTNADDKIFDLHVFFAQVSHYVSNYARKLIYPYDAHAISLDATDTLACLGDNQYQFLPLWAGGNDDETGGVFTDPDIPVMDIGGFSAPGPMVRTGSGASTDDSFSEIGPSDSMSTIHGASHHATFSHISDLMSVDSADIAPIQKKDEGTGHKPAESVFSDESSVPSIQSTEEELDLDDRSDGASTVVMESPRLSDDIEMEHPDSDEGLDDGEFELV